MKSEKLYYLNKIFITNEGYKVKIIEYINNSKVKVEFGNRYNVFTSINNLKKGTIKNPYHISVFGKGYIGKGKYKTSIGRNNIKVYIVWKGMLERCYSDKLHIKKQTYKDCYVDDRWHNFQVFAEWFEQNYLSTLRNLFN